MVVTNYSIPGDRHLRIALAADLHDNAYTQLISEIRRAEPDLIAAAGDIMNENRDHLAIPEEQQYAIRFLEEAVKTAPTFYSLGNNERIVVDCEQMIHWNIVEETGAVLLNDNYVNWNGIWIGGLTSAHSPRYADWRNVRITHRVPNTGWIEEFDQLDGYKILLCHHPEYYPKYLAETGIDLILSGHAHGGEWRIFGRGVYAPGQGYFPKLTSGVHDGRLVISRGLANTARVPRINNPTELVIVDVGD